MLHRCQDNLATLKMDGVGPICPRECANILRSHKVKVKVTLSQKASYVSNGWPYRLQSRCSLMSTVGNAIGLCHRPICIAHSGHGENGDFLALCVNILPTVDEIRPMLLLMSNRKLYMRFRLAARLMTLDDLELLYVYSANVHCGQCNRPMP